MAITKVSRGLLSTGVSDSSDATAITIDSSENVGIGETSPLGKLHVKSGESSGSADANADELVIEGAGNHGVQLLGPNNSYMQLLFGDNDDGDVGYLFYNHSDNSLGFGVNAAERMRIDSSGKVGIGTSSPDRNVTIFASSPVLNIKNSTANLHLEQNGHNGYVGNNSSSGFIQIFTNNGNSTSQFNADGSFQIGAASIANLKFSSSGDVISVTAKKDGTDAIPLTFHTQASGGVTGERMRVQASGNVSIGSTTADAMRLNIDAGGAHGVFVDDIGTGYDGIQVRGSNTTGTFFGMTFKRSNNTMVGYISVGSSSTDYSESGSDLSLKENIEDWNESVLDKFRDIKPVIFNFISDESKEAKKGYIAQNEVDKFPEAYPINPENGKYYFASNRMVVYLMKAIQEQQTIIDDLKTRIEVLEE